MSALDRLLPMPRMLEVDTVDLAVPPERVWEVVRHGDLGRSPFIRALFAVRTVPARILGTQPEKTHLALDSLV